MAKTVTKTNRSIEDVPDTQLDHALEDMAEQLREVAQNSKGLQRYRAAADRVADLETDLVEAKAALRIEADVLRRTLSDLEFTVNELGFAPKPNGKANGSAPKKPKPAASKKPALCSHIEKIIKNGKTPTPPKEKPAPKKIASGGVPFRKQTPGQWAATLKGIRGGFDIEQVPYADPKRKFFEDQREKGKTPGQARDAWEAQEGRTPEKPDEEKPAKVQKRGLAIPPKEKETGGGVQIGVNSFDGAQDVPDAVRLYLAGLAWPEGAYGLRFYRFDAGLKFFGRPVSDPEDGNPTSIPKQRRDQIRKEVLNIAAGLTPTGKEKPAPRLIDLDAEAEEADAPEGSPQLIPLADFTDEAPFLQDPEALDNALSPGIHPKGRIPAGYRPRINEPYQDSQGNLWCVTDRTTHSDRRTYHVQRVIPIADYDEGSLPLHYAELVEAHPDTKREDLPLEKLAVAAHSGTFVFGAQADRYRVWVARTDPEGKANQQKSRELAESFGAAAGK